MPTVIGSNSFVEKIKELFFTDKKHEEVPESRYLAPDIEEIIEAVCKFYNVNKEVLFSSRRGLFRIEKNSTVSSVVERLKLEIERNKNLNKRIGTLRAKLTKIQE